MAGKNNWIIFVFCLFLILVFSISTLGATQAITTCTTLDIQYDIYELQNDVANITDCMTIDAHHVTLDCQNRKIVYAQNGENGGNAVHNIAGYDNTTIRNCYLEEGSSNGTSLYAISFSGVDDSLVENNTIVTLGDSSEGIYFSNSDDGLIINNYINLSGASPKGIDLFTTSDRNIVRYNIINTSGTTSAIGIRFRTTSSNNIIEQNKIYSGDRAVVFSNGPINNYLINNNLTAPNDLEIVDSTTSVQTNFLVYNNSFGEVSWENNGSGGFLQIMNLDADASSGGLLFGTGGNILIQNNTFSFDISIFGTGLDVTSINSSANVTFRGLDPSSISHLRRVENFTTISSSILDSGVNCTSSGAYPCTIRSFDTSTGTLLFHTQGFSSFSSNFSIFVEVEEVVVNVTGTIAGSSSLDSPLPIIGNEGNPFEAFFNANPSFINWIAVFVIVAGAINFLSSNKKEQRVRNVKSVKRMRRRRSF